MEYYDDYDNRELKEANGPSRQPKPPANNMAIVSMILGIFASLLLCMCIAFPVSILLGAGAVCLSIMSKKGGPFSGFAVAGLVLGILAIVFGIIEFLYLIFVSQLLNDPYFTGILEEMMEQYPLSD